MPTVRQRMFNKMNETLADNAVHHNWIYQAIRPLYIPSSYTPGKRIVSDCSKGSQYIAKWSGAPDPFGMGFGPYGNSSSACAHLPHLDHPSQLQVGDYVTFGRYGSEHMTVVKKAGNDPILWSDGHQGAPDEYPLSADHREYQCLHNLVPDIPETPQEVLRSKTGFWAWYQWSIGTGHWMKYGKRNKKVRPNVPRRIPAKWWYHRARLIALKRKNRANKPTT